MTKVIKLKGNLNMKKILAILALATSGSVFAATATVEYQNINGVDGGADQRNVNLTVKESVAKNFAADVQLSNTWNESNGGTSSFRAEVGGTGSMPIAQPLSLYTRVALGEKFTSTGNFSYYSIEPGMSAALGGGLSAKVGYRYRTAFNNPNVNNDTTQTVRVGLGYELSKTDAIGVGFDRVRGDSKQDVWKVNYTRSF